MTALVDTDNITAITPFAVLLISVWLCMTILFWYFGDFGFLKYYILLYVSFLGSLEIAFSLDLRLPPQKWLTLIVAIGFLGWILSLLAYFTN